MFEKLKILTELEILRKRWVKEPQRRDIIERQARAYKIALEKYEEKNIDSFDYINNSIKSDEQI